MTAQVKSSSSHHKNIVIGGGLLGCGIALELAANDQEVLLIERDHLLMNRASLRNEGKIHLGLIYAADVSRSTGIDQLHGALGFRRIIESWIGSFAFKRIRTSEPFLYLVSRHTVATIAELEEHYNAMSSYFKSLNSSIASGLDYLGFNPDSLIKRLRPDQIPSAINREGFCAAYETAERAIDTDDLAREVRNAIRRNPRIRTACGFTVHGMQKSPRGIQLEVQDSTGKAGNSLLGENVFNATWEQRYKIDSLIGIHPKPGLLHRLKFRVIARLPEVDYILPSATVVLGRFGDVVIRPDNTVYLSWYPRCLQGWSKGLAPPIEWDSACRGEAESKVSITIAKDTVKAIADWYPVIAECEVITVDAGSIVAYGETDVDDINSELHKREACILHEESYFSVNAGKLTTAPMIAREAVNLALKGKNLGLEIK